MVICSTPNRMIEEISTEGMEVVSDKVVIIDKTKSATSTNGKQTDAVSGSLAQGGATTPDQAIVATQQNAGTAENPDTTKRSVGRRSVRQADNSRTMQQILTTTIMAECS